MQIKFSNDKPIFMQLADIIKGDIISGKFKINEKLPSVREFAMEYSINPNTVQKALQLLEEKNLIFTDSTNGKFVAENQKEIDKEKIETINNEINLFIEKMQSYGLSLEEIKELINSKGE